MALSVDATREGSNFSGSSRASPEWFRGAAAFTGMALLLVALFAAAAAPSPLFVVYQAEWNFPTWLLSFAFAVYGFAILVALLVVGSLSDYLGRRPVLIAALLLQIAAMTLLFVATDIELVIVARVLQGVATGAATSVLSATITDLDRSKNRTTGPLVGSLAPLVGLALGALLTGVVVQTTSAPITEVFVTFDIVFALGLALVVFGPEPVTRRPGARHSLLPRISVPTTARKEFLASIFVNIAVWLTSSFYLGLVAQVTRDILHLHDGLVNGAAIAVLSGVAAVSAHLARGVTARRCSIAATIALAIGISTAAVGIAVGSLVLFWLATVIAGVGFGTGFGGYIRLLVPLVKSRERSELFAAIYVVSYLTFAIPVVLAGLLGGVFSLLQVVLGYATATVVCCTIGLIAQLRVARSVD